MQAIATPRSQPVRVELRSIHKASFAKVVDGRKQPIRGLWVRNGRFYPRLSVEDANGQRIVRRVPLVNPQDNPVETVAHFCFNRRRYGKKSWWLRHVKFHVRWKLKEQLISVPVFNSEWIVSFPPRLFAR